MREVRGGGIGDDLPGAGTSLNPVLTVGARSSRRWNCIRPARRGGAPRAEELLDQVGIPDPNGGSTSFPSSFPAGCASA
jgi:ABC-type microcin C transport system duplicated ATPase subunit YejF